MYIKGMEKEISKLRIIRNVLNNILVAMIFLAFFGAIYDMRDEIVNGGLGGFLLLMLPIIGIIFYVWVFLYHRQWFSIKR